MIAPRLLAPFVRWTRPALPSAACLLDSLDEAVLAVDAGSRVLFANRSWYRLTGHRSHQRLPQLLDHIHPADRDGWNALRQQLDQADRAAMTPHWLRVVQADGELRWCELRGQPLQADAAWPASLSLCDITPQVRREQLRSASHRSLTQLVNDLPAMLYRARNNRRWTMEYVSEGCQALTGYPAEALLNQTHLSYGEVIHPADAERVWEQVQEALGDRLSFELHYRIRHADGTLRPVSEKGHGVYAENGDVLGVEGVIFALTKIASPRLRDGD
jgi:PAS domain S-box-containing protein